MKNTSSTPPSGWLSALRNTLAVVAITGLGMGSAMAVTLAGTTIGNQAAATYTDASLTPRTATSNTVTTIVAQVAAFTLTANQSQVAAQGAPVNFPHTITNTGNGTDSFALTAPVVGTGIFAAVAPTYFIDANCDGIADNAVPITSVNNVAAGARACFILVANVPVTAASGATGTVIVTASSVFTPAPTLPAITNTDTVTVSLQAIVNVTKSISLASGPAGTTPVTYTLTYTNTGNSAATNVVLADFLPANMTYIAASAKWNGVAVTDAADGDVFDNTVLVGGVHALIPSVAAGQSGTLSFNVTVSAAALPGPIINQARYCYNDGLGVPANVNIPASCAGTAVAAGTAAATSAIAGSGSPTNNAVFTVLQTAKVAANELLGNITIGGVTDTVTVPSASQGATVTFNDYIHNNGNGIDTFNLALSTGTFPAGTTFLLYKADGVTPLVDTNTIPDGIVDTGPIPANGSYMVVVKAVLPSGASGNNAGAGYANILTATSSFNPTGLIGFGFDTVNNKLTTITPNTVDLTTGFPVATIATPTATAGAQGLGAGPSLASVVGGNLVNPGLTVTYPLYVNNTSPVADSYVVSAAGVPAGWSVAYFFDNSAGACTTLGAPATNTGVINGVLAGVAANKVICAVVTTAATGVTSVPGSSSITFTATSATSAAVSDTKLETVTINTVRSVTLTPPNAGQVFPSGSVVYTHILTNTGNVAETAIGMTDPMTGVVAGWANVVYWDSNNNGTLDPADLVVSGVTLNTLTGLTTGGVSITGVAGLPYGASIRLFVKVLSPASAAAGDINTSSLTATVSGVVGGVVAPAAAIAVDNTTVIVGQVLLTKAQALDAVCNGTPNGAAVNAFSNAPITTGAKPGACILYQITATNVGTQPVNNVIISDATPANTTYNTGAVCPAGGAKAAASTIAGAVVTPPATACTAGTVSVAIPTMAPGATGVVSFGVQINP